MAFTGIVVKQGVASTFLVPLNFVYTLRQVNLETGTGPAAVYLETTNFDGTPTTMRLATVSPDTGMQEKVCNASALA